MRVFALSDLHLSFASGKPMGVFGPLWDRHPEKIEAAWRERVGADDLVLVGGDVSWGMKLRDAEPDLAWLGRLPGTKVVVKGNHDYWWASLKKLREASHASILYLQNDAITFGDVTVAGTRLWDFPDVRWPFGGQPEENRACAAKEDAAAEVSPREGVIPEGTMSEGSIPAGEPSSGKTEKASRGEDDEKIRQREIERLRLSLSKLDKNASFRVCLLHYPPVSADGTPGAVCEILKEYAIDCCVFGHIHGLNGRGIPTSDLVVDGIRYVLSSADWLNFSPYRIR